MQAIDLSLKPRLQQRRLPINGGSSRLRSLERPRQHRHHTSARWPPYFSTEMAVAAARCFWPGVKLAASLVDSPGINEGFWLQGLWLQRDSPELGDKRHPIAEIRQQPLIDPRSAGSNRADGPAYNFYVNSTINSTLNLSLPGELQKGTTQSLRHHSRMGATASAGAQAIGSRSQLRRFSTAVINAPATRWVSGRDARALQPRPERTLD